MTALFRAANAPLAFFEDDGTLATHPFGIVVDEIKSHPENTIGRPVIVATIAEIEQCYLSSCKAGTYSKSCASAIAFKTTFPVQIFKPFKKFLSASNAFL